MRWIKPNSSQAPKKEVPEKKKGGKGGRNNSKST